MSIWRSRTPTAPPRPSVEPSVRMTRKTEKKEGDDRVRNHEGKS